MAAIQNRFRSTPSSAHQFPQYFHVIQYRWLHCNRDKMLKKSKIFGNFCYLDKKLSNLFSRCEKLFLIYKNLGKIL